MTKSVWLGVLGFVLTLTVLQGVEAGLVVTIALSVLAALNFRRRGSWLPRVLASLIVLAMISWLFWVNPWLFAVLAVLGLLRLAWTARRILRAGPGAWRHVPRMAWAAFRWRHFSRGQGIAWHDRHRRQLLRFRLPGATHADQADDRRDFSRVQFPRARWRVTPHGIEATVKSIPKVSRVELEQSSQYLADHWRVHRVTVSQPKPGVYVLHGMVRDPLLEQFGLDAAAADWPGAGQQRSVPRHLYLGRDEHGHHRFADLANIPGICVGGMPGSGKSTEITSWLTQLAPSPAVQFALVDGKNAGEFDDFRDRAYVMAGDDLDEVIGLLERQHALMTDRLAAVRSVLGVKNAWHVGPSEAWPLAVTVLDECQSALDASAVKGDKNLEPKVRRAIFLTSSLIRRGRSVMMLTIPATQKPTTDSLPSSVRDNCPVSLCFGVRTTDAAAATLGTAIRDFPSFSPVTLADPAYAGCCTVTLKTGRDPFTRLRCPLVSEDQAAAVARASAHLRKDPVVELPVVVPDDVSALVDS